MPPLPTDAAAPLAEPPWTTLWAGRSHFSVLDTGGQGLSSFLRLWQTWRRDPGRCRRLHVVLLCERADVAGAALDAASAQALRHDPELLQQLHAAWPPLTPNLHPLDLDESQVQLLLCLGPLQRLLPRLHLQADVIWLAGAAAQPAALRLRVLKAVARLSAPGALAWAAPSSSGLLADLRTAGFQSDAQRPDGQVWAWHRPYLGRRPFGQDAGSRPAGADTHSAPARPPRTALVIGAGVAGAAAAQALAQQGLAVTVLERHPQPAAETSGNPAALFHGTVNPDDGLYARLFRAAALVAQRTYVPAKTSARNELPEDCPVQGLLRMQPSEGETGADAEDEALQHMRMQLQRLGLPTGYVQALSAAQASALAGRPLAAPAWFYPGGGSVDPAAWVQQVLQCPGVQFRGRVLVHSLRRADPVWQALDAEGHVLAQADVLVLACAVNSMPLIEGCTAAPGWPLRQTRGQVTLWKQAGASEQSLRLPVAGDGYALPLSGQDAVLCGATRHATGLHDRTGPFKLQAHLDASDSAAEALPTAADEQHNLLRMQRLTGLQPLPGAVLLGRVGWRLHTDDRLPIAGALPLMDRSADGTSEANAPGLAAVRTDQARRWPRCPGLFVLTALGARGLTLAPLLGRLVAAQATGTPWPLEQELADAVDPARWPLRAARQHQSLRQAQDQASRQTPPGAEAQAGAGRIQDVG